MCVVGRDVRAAGGVSIDTAQPVGGVTLRLRLRLIKITLPSASLSLSQGSIAGAGSLPCGDGLVLQPPNAPVEQACPNSPLRPVGGVQS